MMLKSNWLAPAFAAAVLSLGSERADAQSFNCRYAQAPDEVRICQDPALGELDERMSALYFRLRNSLYGGERARLERSQSVWLARRRQCGSDAGCIAAAYTFRIGQLSGW